MHDVERMTNRKIVRKVLHRYGYKGQKRIDEIFGAEKAREIGPSPYPRALGGVQEIQVEYRQGEKKRAGEALYHDISHEGLDYSQS